jgi:hypothetical protein
MNLEAELRALDVDWPETPAFALRPRRRRRWALAAAALTAAAVAAALAVPQSRGAILRFFHLQGATIRVVETLPPARDAALGAGLGDVVPLAAARGAVHGLLLPPLEPLPPLHLGPGNVVSLVFEDAGAPVLLSELPGPGGFLKKLVSGESRVDGVQVGADPGFWLSGRRHVVVFPRRSPRLAGSVLLWEHGAATYRLEGPNLRKEDAIRLALSLRRG